MKKKQLTPEQFQQLLIATANLPFIRQQRQPTSYLSDVLETVLNFQMQEPVVVKALKYFEHNIQHQHDIHTHEQLQGALNIYPDTEDGNKAAAQFFWGNKHWTRIELLRRFLPFLASIGVTDQASLHAWAKQADFDRDFKGRVKGMGIAVFHWLLLRCGVSTIKPDVWVINFGQRVLGKRIPEDRLVTAFNDIAPLIGESLETLDVTIWYHEKMNMATADVPALRLVWWQLLVDEINRKLSTANDSSGVPSAWKLQLDAKDRLRYDKAGLTLTPESLWLRCGQVQAAEVRLEQSVWYEGMVLSLTVTTDQALTAECFERLAPQMSAKGWKVNNASVFTGTTEVEDSLLVPPTTLVSELQTWASEVAATVTEAIEGLHHILHGLENNQAVLRDPAAQPVLVLANPRTVVRGLASNDGHVEARESPGSDVGEVIDMAECLTWIGDTIDEHLNGKPTLSPKTDSP